MPIANTGRLAIWNDCATDYQAEFETWYQTEHLGERLSVPGFRRGVVMRLSICMPGISPITKLTIRMS